MRKLAMCIGLLVVLCVTGCQWATWRERYGGPTVTAGSCDGPGNLYKRVGVGEWTDSLGRRHIQPVYIRVDEAGCSDGSCRVPEGAKGPLGDAGPTGPAGPPSPRVAVTPDGPVRLESLAPPRDANTRYDAAGSTYERKITAVGPPWGTPPAATFEKIAPARQQGERLPSVRTGGLAIGETRAGTFLGGGFEGAADVARSGTGVMFIIGSLAVLGGIVLAIWAGKVWLGVGIAAGGGGLIATAFVLDAYPWLPLVVLLALVGLGVWYVVDARFAERARAALSKTQTALSAVVRGVEAAPDEAQAAVKESIASAATASGDAVEVKRTITDAKAAAGVG